MTKNRLAGAVEAILFASGDAVLISDLADALTTDKETVQRIIKELTGGYESGNRGIKIIELGDSYQMCTNPEYYVYIEALGKTPKKKALSTN